MADFEMVDPARWRTRVWEVLETGHDFLVHLTAVDDIGRADQIRVLAWFDDAETGDRIHIGTAVERSDPHLDTISDLVPGAAWLERQVLDFFGVEFDGGDNSFLLNHDGGAPLRKDVLLEPRTESRWPGALEPGESDASPSRRRLTPPGVPDAEVASDPSANAEQVALSAAGVRMRRGR